jgi:hypothetical protein
MLHTFQSFQAAAISKWQPSSAACSVRRAHGARARAFPICHEKADEKLLSWWVTDKVVSFGDHICWVDYLRGIFVVCCF